MRLSVTVVDSGSARSAPVLLDVDPEDTVGAVAPVLLRTLGADHMHPAFASRVAVWVDGRAAGKDTTVREAGLKAGSVISFGEATLPPDLPVGHAEIRVVGGPGAGRVHRTGLGETLVGCGAPGLSLPDVQLPADALTVRVDVSGEVTVTPKAGLEALLDGKPVTGATAWPAGRLLTVGDTVLTQTQPWRPDTDVTPAQERLGTDFNRPPRLLPAPWERSFDLPQVPVKPRRTSIPWLMVLSPLLLAVPMMLLMGPRYGLFSLLSPVMALFNVFQGRSSAARDYKEAQERYESDSEKTAQRLAQAQERERASRREESPDPAEILLTAVGPGHRLWERRRDDEDYLTLRLGLVDAESTIKVNDPNVNENIEDLKTHLVDNVPATVNMRRNGVVGLAGDPETTQALARSMIGQAAVLHSPRDLRIVVVTDPEGEDSFGWVRWLPHARTDDEVVPATIGSDQDSVARRLGELGQVIATRAPKEGTVSVRDKLSPPPDYLVVLSGSRRLRALPGVVTLLRDGPGYGVTVLCLDDDIRSLPEECRAVVDCAEHEVTLTVTGNDPLPEILPDLVEADWASRIARALAPVQDTTPSAEDSGLPASARLLDCIRMPDPTPDLIRAGWGPQARTDVIIGAGYDGDFRLDLRKDGPHGLVAGTTGSGKSELLQTIVASLAIANTPEQMVFVLVDYKGGSAFKDCNNLPHTVGMVTDLDTHLVGRALTSLGAELRRREHLLSIPGAKDLEDYWAMQASQPGLATIPRLVLVIDEFASLKAELPDFVTGLVTIAQRGRSLGIHLVLATQRPSGVISADIRANTNLRIALRVTDDGESRDVIDAPDSGRISTSTPGRGYARLGPSGVLPFQAGRVGGRRPDAGSTVTERPEPLAWLVPWTKVGVPAPLRPKPRGADTDEGDTDLSVLVEAIQGAAQAYPTPGSPWLPALPELIDVATIRGQGGAGGRGPSASPHTPSPAASQGAAELGPGEVPGIAWAVEDRPDEQAQSPAVFTLGRSGHLALVGGGRSGRSTALRTIVGELARAVPAADLHIYGLDCGNGALLPLTSLPHTGAVVQRTEVERAARLLERLSEEAVRRRDVLGAQGFADINEQRAAAAPHERLPHILLVIDRWEGFMSDLEPVDLGKLHDQVVSIVREGGSVGLQVLVTGDRTLLSGRISALLEHRVVLRMPDAGDYQMVGIKAKQVPVHFPEGRGLWAPDALELQVAVLGPDAGGAAQSAAIREVAALVAPRDEQTPEGLRPFQLNVLPPAVSWTQVEPRIRAAAGAKPDRWLAFGVGGDEVEPLGLTFAGAPVAVVAGAPRTGRTSVLAGLARQAKAAGVEVMLLSPRASFLTDELGDDAFVGLDLPPGGIVERLRTLPPDTLVLIDDAEGYRSVELDGVVNAIVRQAGDKDFRVVLAGRIEDLSGGFSGWVYEARKDRVGVILSPREQLAGEIFGARVSRTALTPRPHPGRGVLFDGSGGQETIQVPDPQA